MKHKPLLPSLREKKRYLVYEVISDNDFDALAVNGKIVDNFEEIFGAKGAADAGLIFPKDSFNKMSMKGFVRVSNTSLDELRASFVFILDIMGKKAIVRSVIASGMINRAQEIVSAS